MGGKVTKIDGNRGWKLRTRESKKAQDENGSDHKFLESGSQLQNRVHAIEKAARGGSQQRPEPTSSDK